MTSDIDLHFTVPSLLQLTTTPQLHHCVLHLLHYVATYEIRSRIMTAMPPDKRGRLGVLSKVLNEQRTTSAEYLKAKREIGEIHRLHPKAQRKSRAKGAGGKLLKDEEDTGSDVYHPHLDASKLYLTKVSAAEMASENDSIETPAPKKQKTNENASIEVSAPKKKGMAASLDFLPDAVKPTYVPTNVEVPFSSSYTRHINFPIVLRDGKGQFQLTASYVPSEVGTCFWTAMKKKMAELATFDEEKIFGTTIDPEKNDFTLQAALYPTLLSLRDHLRPEPLKGLDLGKAAYKKFVEDIAVGSANLMTNMKEHQKPISAATPVAFSDALLRLLPEHRAPTYTFAEHRELIDSFVRGFAQTAEEIRRELIAVAVVASQASSEVSQQLTECHALAYTVCALLEHLDFPNVQSQALDERTKKLSKLVQAKAAEQHAAKTKKRLSKGPEEEGEADDEKSGDDDAKVVAVTAAPAAPTAKESEAEVTFEDLERFKVPRLLVSKMFTEHLCQCDRCDPSFAVKVKTRAESTAKAAYIKDLTEEAKVIAKKQAHDAIYKEIYMDEKKIVLNQIEQKSLAAMTEETKQGLVGELKEEWKIAESARLEADIIARITGLKK